MTTIYGELQPHVGHALEVEVWASGELALICLECSSEIIMDFDPRDLKAVMPCAQCQEPLARRIAVLIEPCAKCGELAAPDPTMEHDGVWHG